MSTSEKFTREKITAISPWSDNLFSFRTTRAESYTFIPGQFARLGVIDSQGEMIWRAYSIVSATYDKNLEFFSVVVPGGEFTSKISGLNIGDEIYIDKNSYGLLTTARFEPGGDLWMLSTGTGLAPFISILYEKTTWEQYDNLILVHSARYANELAYQAVIRSFTTHPDFERYAHKLQYIRCTTRDTASDALQGRITTLMENGLLEQTASHLFDPARSKVMICGNPEMVDDTRKILLDRGLTLSRRGTPGNLATEFGYR